MYYLAQTKVTSLLTEKYKSEVIYWGFDNLQQFNIALGNSVACDKVYKKDIPVNADIKVFSHFKEIGYKSSFLRMIEK